MVFAQQEPQENRPAPNTQWGPAGILCGIAHDFRGPIANLVAASQLAARRAAAGHDVSDLIERIQATGQRLDDMIRNLIDSAAGARELLHCETASVRTTALQVLSSIELGEAKVTLQGPDEVVSTDHTALARILQNLVANAASADPSGQIDVRWTTTPLAFEVEDHGPGLPARAQEHLFEPCVPSAEGHGLGLVTAARLVRHLGGHLELAWTGPSGTCFRFQLAPMGGK